MILDALASAQLSADRLELEITEAVLMLNSEVTLRVLHQLRALGIRVSMDDFGTGYSSLSYLRSFAFDKIKIDRCFIKGLGHRSEPDAIVRAVAGRANSLNMTTTAEGRQRAARSRSAARMHRRPGPFVQPSGLFQRTVDDVHEAAQGQLRCGVIFLRGRLRP